MKQFFQESHGGRPIQADDSPPPRFAWIIEGPAETLARIIRALPATPLGRWSYDACDSFTGRRGYFFLGTVIAAYFGVYAILEAKHERQANRASFERATFMSMVSSGNPGAFMAAMQDFGPIQNMTVTVEPVLWPPSQWAQDDETPNKEKLHRWAMYFFLTCNTQQCSGGQPLSNGKPTRIGMSGADLRKSRLNGVNLRAADLTGADLTAANLTEADLTEADLTGADLTAADLTGANLTRANLTRANLTAADLTGADLTGANLTGAEYVTLARLCQTRSLVRAQLDPEREAKEMCPSKFDPPKDDN